MDRQLSVIANMITLNLHEIKEAGLFGGQTGMALFYYELFRQTGIGTYGDMADGMLCEVLQVIGEVKGNSVEKGLAGIGWGINRLIDDGLVDAESNTLLDIERCILGGDGMELDTDFPFLNPAVYLASKVEGDLMNERYHNAVLSLLNTCKYCCLTIYDGKEKPLCLINSMLYFLLKLRQCDCYAKLASRFLWRILCYLSERDFTNDISGDSVVLFQLLQKVDEPVLLKEQVLAQKKNIRKVWGTETYRRILWQQILFMQGEKEWFMPDVNNLLDLAMDGDKEAKNVLLPLGICLMYQNRIKP